MKELVRGGKPLEEFYLSFLGTDKNFAEELLKIAHDIDNKKFIAQLQNKIKESQGKPKRPIKRAQGSKNETSKSLKKKAAKKRKSKHKKKKNKLAKYEFRENIRLHDKGPKAKSSGGSRSGESTRSVFMIPSGFHN